MNSTNSYIWWLWSRNQNSYIICHQYMAMWLRKYVINGWIWVYLLFARICKPTSSTTRMFKTHRRWHERARLFNSTLLVQDRSYVLPRPILYLTEVVGVVFWRPKRGLQRHRRQRSPPPNILRMKRANRYDVSKHGYPTLNLSNI